MDDDGKVDASTGKKGIITVTAIVTEKEGNKEKEQKKQLEQSQ